MQQKPPRNLLKKYNVHIESDTAFASRARLLQSLWRADRGLPMGWYKGRAGKKIELGSLVELNHAKDKFSNFLTDNIASMVKREIADSEKVIQEPRIWNNLLSSQPLAFNLFGELIQPGYVEIKNVLNNFFPGEVEQVEKICFEYSPGRGRTDLTNDRSAFDVFIEYRSPARESCFLGIEVKYAENMRDKPAKLRPEYDKVANDIAIFKPEAYSRLRKTNIQQLWRDHLLAGSMFISNKLYHKGKFVILYPEANQQCLRAIGTYQDTFNSTDPNKTYFFPITLENFLFHLKQIASDQWIHDFESRYLDFAEVDTLIDAERRSG